MSSSEESKVEATHFTDYGELQFVESPKPHFVFFNDRAKKTDIICYQSRVKRIGNTLQDAHFVARKFISRDMRDETEEVFQEWLVKVKSLVPGGGDCPDKDVIFWKEVTESFSTDEVKTKMVLIVNVHNRRFHIWLKPLWQDLKDPEKPWKPTLRGFLFSLHDNPTDLVRFANRQMLRFREKTPWLVKEEVQVDVLL